MEWRRASTGIGVRSPARGASAGSATCDHRGAGISGDGFRRLGRWPSDVAGPTAPGPRVTLAFGPSSTPLVRPPARLLLCCDGSDWDSALLEAAVGLASSLDAAVSVLVISSGGPPDAPAPVDLSQLRASYAARLGWRLLAAGIDADWDEVTASKPTDVMVSSITSRPDAVLMVHERAWQQPSTPRRHGRHGGDGRRSRHGRHVVEVTRRTPSPVVVVGGGASPARSDDPTRAGPAPLPGRARSNTARPPPLRPRTGRPPPSTDHPRPGRAGGIALAMTLFLIAVLSTFMPSPYLALRPGRVVAVDQHIALRGVSGFPVEGDILITTVSARPVSYGGVLMSWFDEDVDIVRPPKRVRLRESGATSMEEAKANALSVARRWAGPVDPGSVRRIEALIETADVSGPSAGLAIALALIDMLVPEQLTGGLTIAATGSIDSAGRVGPVGAIAQKTIAAREAGANVMFVPIDAGAEAMRHAQLMTVIPVASVEEAVAALRARTPSP